MSSEMIWNGRAECTCSSDAVSRNPIVIKKHQEHQIGLCTQNAAIGCGTHRIEELIAIQGAEVRVISSATY